MNTSNLETNTQTIERLTRENAWLAALCVAVSPLAFDVRKAVESIATGWAVEYQETAKRDLAEWDRLSSANESTALRDLLAPVDKFLEHVEQSTSPSALSQEASKLRNSLRAACGDKSNGNPT